MEALYIVRTCDNGTVMCVHVQKSASDAVLKMDGYQMGQNTLYVAISNPPARNAPFHSAESSSFVPSLGGAKRGTAE